jgi:hypothetical protein
MAISCGTSIQVRRKFPIAATHPEVGVCPMVRRFFSIPDLVDRRHVVLANVRIADDPASSRYATWFWPPRQADCFAPRAAPAHERSLPVPISAARALHGQRKRAGTGGGAVHSTSVLHIWQRRGISKAVAGPENTREGTFATHDGSPNILQGDMAAGVCGWSLAQMGLEIGS